MKAKAVPNGVIISAHVHSSAKGERIEVDECIEVYTREPPKDNRANMAVIKMLSRALGVPRTQIRIVRGSTSRDKELLILGIDLGKLASLGPGMTRSFSKKADGK